MEDRLLFSPGPVPLEITTRMEYSHRSVGFETLYKSCKEKLEEITGRRILFVQGSASAAIEAVLRHLTGEEPEEYRVAIGMHSNGLFANRAAQLAASMGMLVKDEKEMDLIRPFYNAGYAVQFETSESRIFDLTSFCDTCKVDGSISVVDSVSAFPYYPLPKADIVILSSAKQLRGLPVLGIIAYREDFIWDFTGQQPKTDYLSLPRIIEYDKKNQTPHTPMMPQFTSLWASLRFGLWKPYVDEIAKNSRIITTSFKEIVVGEEIAPVITLRVRSQKDVREFLEKRGIEVYFNSSYMVQQIQISTFNYKEHTPYRRLVRNLEICRREGWL